MTRSIRGSYYYSPFFLVNKFKGYGVRHSGLNRVACWCTHSEMGKIIECPRSPENGEMTCQSFVVTWMSKTRTNSLNRIGPIFFSGLFTIVQREKGLFHAWSNVYHLFFLRGRRKRNPAKKKKAFLDGLELKWVDQWGAVGWAPQTNTHRYIESLNSVIRNTRIFICHWRSEWEREKGENKTKKTEGQENLSARERDIFFFFVFSALIIIYFPSFFSRPMLGELVFSFFFSLWLCFVGRENKRRGPSMKDLYLFV